MLDALTEKTIWLMAAAEKAGEDHGSGAFPPFDPAYFPSQLFWFFLTFIALYVLLAKVFLPRVGETIEERGSRIAEKSLPRPQSCPLMALTYILMDVAISPILPPSRGYCHSIQSS